MKIFLLAFEKIEARSYLSSGRISAMLPKYPGGELV